MSPRPALVVIAVVFAILNADITTVNVALMAGRLTSPVTPAPWKHSW